MCAMNSRNYDINIPALSLVILIGSSGSGKSTFARSHFLETEIVSSDRCRGILADDETNQEINSDAFELVYFIIAKRLAAGRLTVVDATNVNPEDRKKLINLARQYHVFPIAIALNLSAELCLERNRTRPDRNFGDHVVKRHTQNLKRSLKKLDREGFHAVTILNSIEQIDSVQIIRKPLWNDRRTESGPFDIIGDIHGCCDELELLLTKLGYQSQIVDTSGELTYIHPAGRKVIFLGDLVDRGPRILDTLTLVRGMVSNGHALCVVGNHDDKLLRKLRGKNVQIKHGLEQSVAEIERLPEDIRENSIATNISFLDGLISHYVLDDGNLVVAHAGLTAPLQGRGSARVRDFAMYGETTGEIDEFGLPVRHNWAAEYRGKAMVVYGHTPVPTAEWLNNTIDIDTGCVFGGKLTALQYPEKTLVSVDAARVYCEPIKPLLPPEIITSSQQAADRILDIEDVTGKRLINTRLFNNIAIREENSIAALEAMSRFAANPQWLIYLPPTMSPVATAKMAGYLEYPTDAFDYYRSLGVKEVICEEKHMGSRAVVIICRDRGVARDRFGIEDEGIGICYTRTGRKFFDDDRLSAAFLDRLQQAITKANVWSELDTDWLCLDCELMPWSAKAQQLIRQQYAPVGMSARVTLSKSIALLERAQARGIDVSTTIAHYQTRSTLADDYVSAYRRYCWEVNSLDDLLLAPFHILASAGKVHVDKTHDWHLATIAKICQTDPQLLLATQSRSIDLDNPDSVAMGVDWWLELTAKGGEGMVVKPRDFLVTTAKGLIQPAVKCRGREYLRIIYGAEYTLPQHLDKLRDRSLNRKRSLALREFALGIEALESFTHQAPLRRTHECTFAILALESEPIDPRL
jgi:protein phosphatase